MTTPILDASAAQLNLKSTQGDPLSFKFLIDANWSGTYVSQVRATRERTSTLHATLTVAAVLLTTSTAAAYVAQGVAAEAGHTEFTISLTAPLNTVPVGTTAWWDMQQQTPGTPPSPGVTRLSGRFLVMPEITVLP